jgi:hypothetical protein
MLLCWGSWGLETMEVYVGPKRTSLLQNGVNYQCKKFYSAGHDLDLYLSDQLILDFSQLNKKIRKFGQKVDNSWRHDIQPNDIQLNET